MTKKNRRKGHTLIKSSHIDLDFVSISLKIENSISGTNNGKCGRRKLWG